MEENNLVQPYFTVLTWISQEGEMTLQKPVHYICYSCDYEANSRELLLDHARAYHDISILDALSYLPPKPKKKDHRLLEKKWGDKVPSLEGLLEEQDLLPHFSICHTLPVHTVDKGYLARCHMCRVHLRSPNSFIRHIRDHKGNIPCKKCDQVFPNRSEWQKHHRADHHGLSRESAGELLQRRNAQVGGVKRKHQQGDGPPLTHIKEEEPCIFCIDNGGKKCNLCLLEPLIQDIMIKQEPEEETVITLSFRDDNENNLTPLSQSFAGLRQQQLQE